MKTTRRGLFAWLGALTGAAAVSRVVPAEASIDEMAASVVRNSKLPSHEAPIGSWDLRDGKIIRYSAGAPETEAMRAGRLLAEQHARDIEAGRKLRTPEDVIEMLRQSPTSKAIRAAQAAIDAEAKTLYGKPVRLNREHGVTEPTTSKAFTLTPRDDAPKLPRYNFPVVIPSYGSLDERCPGHRRGCDLGMGHAPYAKCSGYEPGSGGWTIGDLKNEAT